MKRLALISLLLCLALTTQAVAQRATITSVVPIGSPLSTAFFGATTSAQLAGVLSNETGSGLAVFGTSPTLITPLLTSGISVRGIYSGNAVAIIGDGTASQYSDLEYNGASTANYGVNFSFQSGGVGFAYIAREGRIAGGTSNNLLIRTSGATSLSLGTNGADNVVIASGGAITINSTFKSTAGNDLGWTVQNAANQACNTTCTVGACVIGIDAITTAFLACTDATADSCLCAG